ncbi:MAG: GNAT family N-acetyltransferase [Lachnospiraceae bacterium]|nr:GNAT family N-acetyltransferase [Lachnospiraceae bacterium]
MQFRFYTFSELDTQTLYEILAHRFEIFVLGQGNIYRDLDGFDQKALHLVARDEDGVIQGYVRLLPADLHYDGYNANAFGRLSVKEGAREKGLGSQLVRLACEKLLQDNECKVIQISAMAYLEHFYQELGFVTVSEIFTIADVPHITMLYKGR